MSGVGEGAQQFATAANEVQTALIAEQRQHDETAVNDMYATQFDPAIRSLLYDPKTGYFAKQGRDALDSKDATMQAAQQAREQFRDALQNDNQKRVFDVISRRHLQSELDAIERHATQQDKVWKAKTSDAVVDSAAQNAVLNFNDPARVDGYLASGRFEIRTFGQDNGWSAEMIRQREQEFARTTRTAIAERMLVSDPMGASQYIKTHAGDLAGPHFAALEHKAKVATVPIIATTDADSIMRESMPSLQEQIDRSTPETRASTAAAVTAATDTLSSLKRAIRGAEASGANQVSVQRAAGVMQITPNTFKQYAKPGESFDNEKDRVAAAERKIEDDFRFYGGDVRKVAAAYIGGRGAVNDKGEIVDYAPNGNLITDANGMTRSKYAERVLSIMGRTGTPSGTPATSFDVRAKLGEWIAEAERRYPNDPIMRNAVIEKIKSNVSTVVAAKEGQQRQAIDSLKPALLGADGMPAPTSLAELMSRPNAAGAVLALDGAGLYYVTQHIETNQRRLLQQQVKSDPALVINLTNRIYSDGPDRIASATQLLPYVKADGTGVSMHDFEMLQRHLSYAQTPEGKAFGVDRKNVVDLARRMLVEKSKLYMKPEMGEDAAKRFADDLDRKIDEYRKVGKDPRELFNSASKEYVGVPERVMTFLPTAQQMVSASANTARATPQVPAKAPVKIKNDAEFNALPSGAEFIGPDGVKRTKP